MKAEIRKVLVKGNLMTITLEIQEGEAVARVTKAPPIKVEKPFRVPDDPEKQYVLLQKMQKLQDKIKKVQAEMKNENPA